MSIADEQRLRDQAGTPGGLGEHPATPWRVEVDPFAQAPVPDLSVLIGGLPDDRDANEILEDLAACGMKRVRR